MAQEDSCGVCDTDPRNDCAEDCAGVWGGTATRDNCGTCDSNPANDCVQDCAGMWGGTATSDNCGVCDTDPDNDCTSSATVIIGDHFPQGCETSNSCYMPHRVDLAVGGTVTWKHTGATENHGVADGVPADSNAGNLFCRDGSGVKLLTPRASCSHSLSNVGVYPYFCLIHPWAAGEIIVK